MDPTHLCVSRFSVSTRGVGLSFLDRFHFLIRSEVLTGDFLMVPFGRLASCMFLTAVLLGPASIQAAITWDGGGADDNLTTAENWVGDIAPLLNVSNANSDVIFTGNLRLNPLTSEAIHSYRTVNFDANASAFTFGGTTEFLFNNSGSATNASVNNSSFAQTFNVDVGMRRVNLNANTADFIFNNPVRLFTTTSTFTGLKDIYLNAGLRGTASFSRLGTGTTFIPAESTGWTGVIGLTNGNVEISHPGALGEVGSRASQYSQIQSGTAANSGVIGGGSGSLVLTNDITIGEYIYLDARNAFNAHIKNKSGTNTISGTIEIENGNLPVLTGTLDYAIQSDAGQLNITGPIVVSEEEIPFATLALQGASNGSVSGDIGGPAGGSTSAVLALSKRGSGTWTITGTNVYGGPTTVEEGTLSLGASGSISNSSGIDVKSGAFLVTSGLSGGGLTLVGSQSLKGAGTITGSISAGSGNTIIPGDSVGTLTLSGDLTLSGGSTLQYELSSNPLGSNDKIVVGGVLAAAGNTLVNVSAVNGSLGSGSYRLIDYAGGAVTDPNSTFTLSGLTLSPRQTASFSSVANQVNLDVVGSAGNLTWVGGLNSNAWDINTTVNWTGEPDSHFFDGDLVTFSSTGSNSPDVNIAGTVSPAQVSFTNGSGHDYNLTGGNVAIGGDLVASGSGNATLANSQITVAGSVITSSSGNLSFANSGGTTITGNFTPSGSGTVSVTNSSMSVTGNMTVTGSGNVQIANSDFSVAGSFTQNGTGTVTLANTGTLTLPSTIAINSGTVALDLGSDLTWSKVMTGGGTFRKEGLNTVTITGNNSGFVGEIVVAEGILKGNTGNANALGTGAGGTTVVNGATLDIFSVKFVNEVVTIEGEGAAGQLGALVDTRGAGTAGANRGQIKGIILTGDATIAASPNTYPFIDSSTQPGASFQGNGHNLTMAGGGEWDFYGLGETGLANITIKDGPTYFGTSTTLGSNAGVVTLQNSGRLGLDASPAVTKAIIVDATGGGIECFGTNNTVDAQITLNGGAELNVYTLDAYTDPATITKTLTLNGKLTGPGALTVHAAPRNGTAEQKATRLGNVTLTSNANDYTGATLIGGGGGYSGVAAADDRITLSVGNGGASGALGAGDVVVNAAGTLQFNRTGTFSVANNIAGGGNVSQVAAGGTATLTGTLTYTGDTIVTAGTLDISSSHTTGNAYNVAAGGALITNNVRANTLTVDGSATVRADGGTNGASKVETLAMTGQLNLKNNDLVIGTGVLADVRTQIKSGLSGISNTAAATGITSDVMTLGTHGFGYASGDNPSLNPILAGSLSGQTYDGDSVLVKFTYRGDADLDGDSDLDDLGFWANSFTGDLGLGPLATPTTLWTQGDWDYDGDTDLDDLGFWSSTFTGDLGGGGLSVYAPDASEGAIAALAQMGITAVPEPGSVFLLSLGFGGIVLRKLRRRR